MPVHAVDELPELLAEAEIVIVTLPGGDETRHIVDDAFLSALPDGALVVNVGRGPLIDTDALVDHVAPRPHPRRARRDRPRAAAGGSSAVVAARRADRRRTSAARRRAMQPRIARLVRTQIERMLAGEPPLNVVYES